MATTAVRKVDLRKTLIKRMEVLNFMRNKFVLLCGRMGKGKTLSIIYMAYWMRELFGLPVVQFQTNTGLTKKFGDHIRLDDRQFLEQLLLLTDIAEEISEQRIEDQEAYMDYAQKYRGLVLYKCILVVDEAQKLVLSLRSNDRMALAISEFVQQMRHYKVTVLAATANARNLHRLIRDQVAFWCVPDYNPYTQWYRLNFRSDEGRIKLEIYGPDVWPLYYSWSVAGFSRVHIDRAMKKDTNASVKERQAKENG
jgi:hypothetical protein